MTQGEFLLFLQNSNIKIFFIVFLIQVFCLQFKTDSQIPILGLFCSFLAIFYISILKTIEGLEIKLTLTKSWLCKRGQVITSPVDLI